MLTVGSLFSGIGGLELGLERTGRFKTIWQCEFDAYASAVLKKHWPEVPNLGDITKVEWDKVERPDLICGGFPCQDISNAGKKAGIKEGNRSGLWFEFHKAICALRPRYALIENVSAITNDGLHIVLAGLAQAGYNAEWFTLQAAEVGAPHRRERLFILATNSHDYNNGQQCSSCFGKARGDNELGSKEAVVDSTRFRWRDRRGQSDFSKEDGRQVGQMRSKFGGSSKATPNLAYSASFCIQGLAARQRERQLGRSGWWAVEPDVGRVANGVPSRVDRIKCLGNAVVPQVAQVIGEAILEIDYSNRKVY